MPRASKIRASKLPYQSVSQLTLEGFETPFSQQLHPQNRWIILAHRIPWDDIVSVYDKLMRNDKTGAGHINGRVIIGSLVIKHMCNLSDEETLLQIQENMYMQYFIGYSGFSTVAPFDSSLFVEIRKRLGLEQINAINEKIVQLSNKTTNDLTPPHPNDDEEPVQDETTQSDCKEHEGRLLLDATACPQDIAYPTDLNILNDSREKSEQIIDTLYDKNLHGGAKPRTYRENARTCFLKTAQKKVKSKNEIRIALGKQLRFLKRNIKSIFHLLDAYDHIPLDTRSYKYLLVIQETYRQQQEMRQKKTHSIENRIVNIHQPHVRPIVRGKAKAKVEFGSKIQLSLVKGYAFLDHLKWEAFNEGTMLMDSVEQYKRRNGFWPKEVLADKIYCNRENRRRLKELGIHLIAKPLGRPSAVKIEHLRPGERNPIEGKFGQAKTAYGLDRIKARLNQTSESWIASIILVLNLVKLAGQVPFALLQRIVEHLIEIAKPKRTILLIQ